jgi:hypothetical protein
MKLQPLSYLLLLPTVGLLLQSPVYAQSKVVVAPSSITITATQGTTETRTIAVRSSEAIVNPQMIPFDLANADGSQVLPVALVQVGKPSTQETVNVVSFPIQFNLQSAPSGEFIGEMLLTYQGDEQVIPVIVRVKGCVAGAAVAAAGRCLAQRRRLDLQQYGENAEMK